MKGCVRGLPVLLPLALPGCGVTSYPTCEVTSSVVLADDEVSPLGFSPAELLAVAVGPREIPGTLEDGSAVTVTLGATRAEGDAVYEAREPASVERPDGRLFGVSYTDMSITCQETVSVPAMITVLTDGGEIDYAALGEITAHSGALPEAVSLDSTVAAADASGLPPVDEEGVEEAFAQADLGQGDAAAEGEVGWQGTEQSPTGDSQTWARYLLEFQSP